MHILLGSPVLFRGGFLAGDRVAIVERRDIPGRIHGVNVTRFIRARRGGAGEAELGGGSETQDRWAGAENESVGRQSDKP